MGGAGSNGRTDLRIHAEPFPLARPDVAPAPPPRGPLPPDAVGVARARRAGGGRLRGLPRGGGHDAEGARRVVNAGLCLFGEAVKHGTLAEATRADG